MPYIKGQQIRDMIREFVSPLAECITSEGELNFAITTLLLEIQPTGYHDYNSIMGVLECVKQEFYRRAVAAYEDQKIKENGDVY